MYNYKMKVVWEDATDTQRIGVKKTVADKVDVKWVNKC